MAAPNPLPSGSTLMPSSVGSLPSTVADVDVSTSRADLHIDRIYTNPLGSIAENDNSTETVLIQNGLQIHPQGNSYYCPACLETFSSVWEATQHVRSREHVETIEAVDFNSSDDDDEDPYAGRCASETEDSLMSSVHHTTPSATPRPSFPPPPGFINDSRVSLTPRPTSSSGFVRSVRLTPASSSRSEISSSATDFDSFGGVNTPPTRTQLEQEHEATSYRERSYHSSSNSYDHLRSICTDRSIHPYGRTPEEFMASRRERITQLIPNPDAMRRRESTREWRYSQPDGNPNKRFRDDDDITKMRAKFPRVTPLCEAEILHGEFGVKYSGNWSEEANTWLVEVKPICIVLGEKIVEKIPEEEISVLEDSILCNICDVFVETAGISDNMLRDIEAEHRSDPVHLTQREKLRKRFGICEAFNKEIDKIKSHRIKLAISANGYPRHFWCSCCDAHLKTPEAVHFHTGINAHRSNLMYHDWCDEVGQDPRLYYKSGWHFPAKEVSKEEFLPKFDDMKVEDISYLTKGEAAGANYCCRCNVTLASPWEIRQHLRTKSHRERSAVGVSVDERPPLIELEPDIPMKKYEDEVKSEDGDEEIPPPGIEPGVSEVDKEIEEVWGSCDDEEKQWPRFSGEPSADEFERMVSSIINGEEFPDS